MHALPETGNGRDDASHITSDTGHLTYLNWRRDPLSSYGTILLLKLWFEASMECK